MDSRSFEKSNLFDIKQIIDSNKNFTKLIKNKNNENEDDKNLILNVIVNQNIENQNIENNNYTNYNNYTNNYTNNYNNYTNINVDTMNNIIVNSLGEEKYDHISDEEFYKICKSPYNAVSQIVEKIHIIMR